MIASLRARRARGDRGAVLVEAAFVFPVLMTLLFGIVEFGFAWRDKITVETATRAGARTASNLGPTAQADYNTVQTVLSAMSSIPTANVDIIVIFDASTSGTVSATCAAGTPITNNSAPPNNGTGCNVYTASQFSLGSASYGCGGSSPDRFWCPTGAARQNSMSQTNGPAYIGVYVKAHRAFITKIFGTTGPTMTSTSVLRLEPPSS
jgi:Flp pilus assembly protein TadG